VVETAKSSAALLELFAGKERASTWSNLLQFVLVQLTLDWKRKMMPKPDQVQGIYMAG
jgi:hypothetical protein